MCGASLGIQMKPYQIYTPQGHMACSSLVMTVIYWLSHFFGVPNILPCFVHQLDFGS